MSRQELVEELFKQHQHLNSTADSTRVVNFSDDQLRILTMLCPASANVVRPGRYVVFPCLHKVCLDCFQHIRQFPNQQTYCCPECRTEHNVNEYFPDAALNVMLDGLLQAVVVECINKENGCTWKGGLSDEPDHLDTSCAARPNNPVTSESTTARLLDALHKEKCILHHVQKIEQMEIEIENLKFQLADVNMKMKQVKKL
ncbi:UNVERIFIED_CONTAM: hypothetical protein HDU68_005944, partial [Siphonaria sp. JEL0065]